MKSDSIEIDSAIRSAGSQGPLIDNPSRDRAIRPRSRRGFLKIAAAAAIVPAVAGSVRALAPQGKLYDWQLETMGTVSELALWHHNPAVANRAIEQVRTEVARLDGIFSLHRDDS